MIRHFMQRIATSYERKIRRATHPALKVGVYVAFQYRVKGLSENGLSQVQFISALIRLQAVLSQILL
jgi:hypothetical protein